MNKISIELTDDEETQLMVALKIGAENYRRLADSLQKHLPSMTQSVERERQDADTLERIFSKIKHARFPIIYPTLEAAHASHVEPRVAA